MVESNQQPAHFKGKEAIAHVAEAQAQGIISSSEIHGTELPGHLSAATDAAREVAFVIALIWLLLSKLGISQANLMGILLITSGGLILWKTGRGAWLAWFRLERLHRIVAQEKWEIEHHRQQEREELKALYAAKGFEGKLLEEVLDVLMADGDRLLRVMIEEELGLSLESHEHPLKQSLGALAGAILGCIIPLLGLLVSPSLGIIIGALLAIALGASIAAFHEKNRIIPAMIWNIGIGAVAFGFVYFILDYIIPTHPYT